jgi:hypothetical protein
MVKNLDVNVFLYLNDFSKGFLVCIHIQFWQKKYSAKFINSLDFYSALIKFVKFTHQHQLVHQKTEA